MLAGEGLTAFKRDDWHQQIKLFPAAINIGDYPIPTTEFLDLAPHEFVESQPIHADYEVQFGPFQLDKLAEQSMLMLQCVECHIDHADTLLRNEFSFLPAWQVEDTMASIGNDGASCGPHFDRYDVFLLQLTGTKTWRLDASDHKDSDLQDNVALRLLKTFEPTTEILSRPGEVLYVPSGVGHHGICAGESVTLSIGIRNPTMIELLAEISEFALLESELDILDTELREQGARIDSTSIMPLINQAISPRSMDIWYGCYVTRLRNPEVLCEYEANASDMAGDAIVDTEVTGAVAASRPTRLAWGDSGAEVLLFVNGEYYRFGPADKPWIVDFCDTRTFPVEPGHTDQLELARELFETGAAHLI